MDPGRSCGGPVFGVALPFPHNGEKLLSPQGFFGLFKNKRHQPLLLLFSLLLRTVIWMISDKGGTYAAHVTGNYRRLTRISVLQSQTENVLRRRARCAGDGPGGASTFEKSLVLL